MTDQQLAQTLEDGLISHYLFDSNAQDTSGNNLHCTVYGATLTTDRFGNSESAYQFDGVDDYIEVPHDDLLNLTDNFTISLWIKQEEGKTPGYRLVDKTTAGVNDGYLFDTYDGSTGRRLRLCAGIEDVSANTVYSLNEWHHVAVVFSKGVSTFYLDGKPDGSEQHNSPSIRTNSLNLLIGRAHTSKKEFFKGALDDIRIYNRALSEQEIKEIYQLPSSKTTKDGVTNWSTDTFEGVGFKLEHSYWKDWHGQDTGYVKSELRFTNTTGMSMKAKVFVKLNNTGFEWNTNLRDSSGAISDQHWIDFGEIAPGHTVEKTFWWGLQDQSGDAANETFQTTFDLMPKVEIEYSHKDRYTSQSTVET